MRPEVLLGCLFVGLVSGCTPAKPGSEGTESGATGPAASSAAAPPATASAAAVPALETWSGKYVSATGSLYVFDAGAYAGVTWHGDEAGTGLGEGPLTITLDRKIGAARGTASGAIGDVVLAGTINGDAIGASVLRKDPLDRGFTGTLVARPEGDRLVGTMRLSVADARVIREARFELTREKR